MVGFRIERVVNWMAIGCAQTLVVFDHRGAAAIGKNKIVFANERAKRISRIGFHPRQGCGSIHIPESDPGIFGSALQNFLFQQLVKYANATVLDDQITVPGLLQQCRDFVSIFVNHCIDVAEIAGIAVLQAAICIRLCEGDVMAQRVKLLVNSAVVSCRSIPVRRRDAGAKDENLHREISWHICISSCARWAQVWRSRMVRNPFSASWYRALPSRRRYRNCSVISAPSRTTT